MGCESEEEEEEEEDQGSRADGMLRKKINSRAAAAERGLELAEVNGRQLTHSLLIRIQELELWPLQEIL